jgi:hypothetical protein
MPKGLVAKEVSDKRLTLWPTNFAASTRGLPKFEQRSLLPTVRTRGEG